MSRSSRVTAAALEGGKGGRDREGKGGVQMNGRGRVGVDGKGRRERNEAEGRPRRYHTAGTFASQD